MESDTIPLLSCPDKCNQSRAILCLPGNVPACRQELLFPVSGGVHISCVLLLGVPQ